MLFDRRSSSIRLSSPRTFLLNQLQLNLTESGGFERMSVDDVQSLLFGEGSFSDPPPWGQFSLGDVRSFPESRNLGVSSESYLHFSQDH